MDRRLRDFRQRSSDLPPPGRIVVVDDDPGIRDVVHDFLTRHGYDVETAADAAGLNRALSCAGRWTSWCWTG